MRKFALLIIDMQKDFVFPDSPVYVKRAKITVPKIKKILNFFRNKKWKIFHIKREYHRDGSNVENVRINIFKKTGGFCIKGEKGSEIIDELKPEKDEFIIIKPRFSAFFNTELDLLLRRFNITDTVICGTQYPNCIRATVFDAISLDYNPVVLTDAISAQTIEIEKANIYDLKNTGVECIEVEEFIKKYG